MKTSRSFPKKTNKNLSGEELLKKAFTGNSKIPSERERKEKELKDFLRNK